MLPIYFISLGSNIHPQANIIHILHHLLRLTPRLTISRIIETPPMGLIAKGDNFLNGCVALTTSESKTTLKSQFNHIETILGRNRTDPQRGSKSRPADIDILFALPAGQTAVSPTLFPPEPFLRPILLELIHFLDLTCPLSTLPPPTGTSLMINGVSIGTTPIHLYQNPNTGHTTTKKTAP